MAPSKKCQLVCRWFLLEKIEQPFLNTLIENIVPSDMRAFIIRKRSALKYMHKGNQK